jgi:hypothetical protein
MAKASKPGKSILQLIFGGQVPNIAFQGSRNGGAALAVAAP